MKTFITILIFGLVVAAFAVAPGQPTSTQIRVYHREHGTTNAAYALGRDGKWKGNVPRLDQCREPANADYVWRTRYAPTNALAVSTNAP